MYSQEGDPVPVRVAQRSTNESVRIGGQSFQVDFFKNIPNLRRGQGPLPDLSLAQSNPDTALKIRHS